MSIAKVVLATDVPVRKGASSSGHRPLKRYSYSVYTFQCSNVPLNATSAYASVSFGADYNFDENSIICCLQCKCAEWMELLKNVEVWIAGGDRRFFSHFSNLQLTGDGEKVSETMRIAITGEEMSAICTEQKADRIFVMFSGYLVFKDNDKYEVSCETVDVPDSLFFSEQHLVSHRATVTGPTEFLFPRVNLTTAFEGDPFKQDSITNFVVKCGDKEFHVHDAILVGRSAFLKKMLGVDMMEKKEKKLVLDPESFRPEVVEKFLTKLYDTGYQISVENVSELSVLLQLFHMYEIQDAVQECGKLLELQLQGEAGNVFAVLKASFLCGLEDVFAKAVTKLRGMGGNVWERPEMVALGPNVLAAALKAALIK